MTKRPTWRSPLLDGPLQDVPGDTVPERIVWLREALIEQREKNHDIELYLTRLLDSEVPLVSVKWMLKVIGQRDEETMLGGEVYKGLTLVDQRSDNDCMRACIASLTGIDYEHVLDINETPDTWRQATDVWASNNRGRWIRRHGHINWPLNRTTPAFMAFGASPRRSLEKPNLTHAILVNRWGELVFDPHYSRRGILGPVLETWQWSVDLSSKQGR